MGGRGAAGGVAKTGRIRGSTGLSGEAKSSYEIEMSDANNFSASFVLENNTSKDAIGYQMYVHKDVTGRSLIADTQKEITELKRAYRSASVDGKSYGMSNEAIRGMKRGIQDKITLREMAVQKMTSARAEYDKYSKDAQKGAAKAKRNGGTWL